MRDEHHVLPNPNGGWDIKRGGSKKVIKHWEIKKDAVAHARQISRKQKTELVIRDKKGRFQNLDSHGNDPFPPRDKK